MNDTIETFCVYCFAKLTWTKLFCRLAPNDFNYFDCGRHRRGQ